MQTCRIAMVILLIASPASAQIPKDVPPAIPLWPSGAPGSEKRAAEAEELVGGNLCNAHNPSITPFLPDPAKSSGTAIIICPGGGCSKLCLGHEGYALAEWFRDRGIVAIVLKYRLAREKGSTYTIQDHAMADTRRASAKASCASTRMLQARWPAIPGPRKARTKEASTRRKIAPWRSAGSER